MASGQAIVRTTEEVQISQIQLAFNASFHRELSKYVRGGCHTNQELIEVFRKAYGPDAANFQMLEKHVWWPIIEEPDIKFS
ncbi:hypothetical protein AVO44_19985 [Ruegeria profundi]|uniref:Uncharacterized protein n=1 Tax=Ruegeria profundi TaxID=1685378 RepID=A0A0X3TDH2_9RHOB|nr:hypothetical protein AVO44_19985 [Ruegeria profundi]